MRKAASDPRLEKLNAIVFLQVKPKGKNNTLTPLKNLAKYKQLMDLAQELKVGIGFDSCSAPNALKTVDKKHHDSIENCESTGYSLYISCEGEVYPCSFTEGTTSSGDWTTGIKMSEVNDFVKDVWYNPRIMAWREKLKTSSSSCSCEHSTGCRSCIVYDITPCNNKPELSVNNNLVQIK